MKKMTRVLILSALAAALSLTATYGQGGPRRGGGGWGAGGQYGRMYDTNTVGMIKGEVVTVDKFTPGKGMSAGVHLQLKTRKEAIFVHLGPSWFIDNQEMNIEPNDKLEVKGSRVTFDGKPAIIAAEITKEGHVLKLRDERGFPAWSGWRRR